MENELGSIVAVSNFGSGRADYLTGRPRSGLFSTVYLYAQSFERGDPRVLPQYVCIDPQALFLPAQQLASLSRVSHEPSLLPEHPSLQRSSAPIGTIAQRVQC